MKCYAQLIQFNTVSALFDLANEHLELLTEVSLECFETTMKIEGEHTLLSTVSNKEFYNIIKDTDISHYGKPMCGLGKYIFYTIGTDSTLVINYKIGDCLYIYDYTKSEVTKDDAIIAKIYEDEDTSKTKFKMNIILSTDDHIVYEALLTLVVYYYIVKNLR